MIVSTLESLSNVQNQQSSRNTSARRIFRPNTFLSCSMLSVGKTTARHHLPHSSILMRCCKSRIMSRDSKKTGNSAHVCCPFFNCDFQLIQMSIFPQLTLISELLRRTTRNAKSCERHCTVSRTASRLDPWRSSKARSVASFFRRPFQP